ANNTAHLEALLHSQTARLNKLGQQMDALQQQSQQARHSPQPLLSYQQQQTAAQPHTLRQAMAAAERDLKQHLATVQEFYHRVGVVGGGGAVGRAVTEHTADLLARMQEAVKAA